MAVRRIVVTGDCLRPGADGNFGGSNNNTGWLHRLIAEQVALACGLRPELLLLSGEGGIDAAGYYLAQGFLDPRRGWALIHSDPDLRDSLAELFAPHLQDALVLGFELPRYLRAVLDFLNVPYIDFWINPVRFLDDLLFAARSSHPEVNDALREHAYPEELVRVTAGLRQATLSLLPPARFVPGSLLVLGQTRHCKSQIGQGRFVDAQEDHEAEVLEVLDRYPGSVLLKAHPADPSHSLLDLVRSLRPEARPVSDNIYYLLAQPGIAGVLTVNSSVAAEAPYFGKQVHRLAAPALSVSWRGQAQEPGRYTSLDDVVLAPDFWRRALRPLLPTTPCDGVRLPTRSNRLRVSLRAFWDFNRIDTDLLAQIARPPHYDSAAAPNTDPNAGSVSILGRMNVVPGIALLQQGTIRVGQTPGLVLFGPYIEVPAGWHTVTIHYQARPRSTTETRLFGMDVSAEAGKVQIVPPIDILSAPGEAPGQKHAFSLAFRLTRPARYVETRIWHHGLADLVIADVRLRSCPMPNPPGEDTALPEESPRLTIPAEPPASSQTDLLASAEVPVGTLPAAPDPVSVASSSLGADYPFIPC